MKDEGLQRVHLLHIGKTGGSAVKHAVAHHLEGPSVRLILHPHRIHLRDVPQQEGLVFFVRDPLSRFVSGFNSRLRQGRPRYFRPWNNTEVVVFQRFATPDMLGRALGAEDPEIRSLAEVAMRGIGHVRSSYWDWFEDETLFRKRLDDFVFIGEQEALAADFEALKVKLGLPAELALPTDEVIAHKTPPDCDTHLSEDAAGNLAAWYSREYEFLALCRTVRDVVNSPAHGLSSRSSLAT